VVGTLLDKKWALYGRSFYAGQVFEELIYFGILLIVSFLTFAKENFKDEGIFFRKDSDQALTFDSDGYHAILLVSQILFLWVFLRKCWDLLLWERPIWAYVHGYILNEMRITMFHCIVVAIGLLCFISAACIYYFF